MCKSDIDFVCTVFNARLSAFTDNLVIVCSSSWMWSWYIHNWDQVYIRRKFQVSLQSEELYYLVCSFYSFQLSTVHGLTVVTSRV